MSLQGTTSNNVQINEWIEEWNSFIIHNIHSIKELESQCMVTKCSTIQRLIFIMKFYGDWIDINGSKVNDNNINE